MKSILVGNGINIQFANAAYSSEFIIKRAYFNSLQGKYDSLFNNEILGKDVANIIKSFIFIGNNILDDKFSYVEEPMLKEAIEDFKDRYRHIKSFTKYSHIMLEDWFLLIKLFFIENTDVEEQWLSAKQGFEQIFLDAIYNDGYIENIHTKMTKDIAKYLKSFDCIFSLNYDSNIETLINKEVFHLHGCYNNLSDGENKDTVLGYMRFINGEQVLQEHIKHCFCNALLDYSGRLKKFRTEQIDKLSAELDRLKQLNRCNPSEYEKYISEIKKRDEHSYSVITTSIANPLLSAGTNYHFNDLSTLTGELVILGMSPNNDAHIFESINESSIEKVYFYNYGSLDVTLPISKPYEILNVDDLWNKLGAKKKVYNTKIVLPKSPKVKDFFKLFDSISLDSEPEEIVVKELNKIPRFEVDRLCGLTMKLLKQQKADGNPKSEEELLLQFSKISSIALREGVLPKTLFLLTIMNFNENK